MNVEEAKRQLELLLKSNEKMEATIISDRGRINKAIKELTDENPTPNPGELKESIRYQNTGVFASALFAKDMLISKEHDDATGDPIWSEQQYKEFIDKLVRENIVNNVRCYLLGQWGWRTHDLVHLPHEKVDGKFDINRINSHWWEQVKRRIKYAVDRKMTLRLIVDDQSSFNATDSHWILRDNNHGWENRPTYYDKYGPTKFWNYCKHGGECTPEEKQMYCATMEYYLDFWDRVIPEIWELGKPYVVFEHNEIDAAHIYHDEKKRIFRGYGIPREHTVTSVRGEEWPVEKPILWREYILDEHGLKDLQSYEIRKVELASVKKPWIVSSDGFGDHWLGDLDGLHRLARKVFADGNMMQGNEWFPNRQLTHYDYNTLNWTAMRAVMDEFEASL